jgi:aminoglycoside phosphotransferase (APT) family kinase protein
MMDQVKLQHYLSDHISGFGQISEVKKLRGGRSNPNYLILTEKTNYVLRSQPHGKLLQTAHDMGREYRVLSSLADSKVPVPLVFCLCEDISVLGVTFYVMEYVEGDISQSFYLEQLSKEQIRTTYINMIEVLADLHKVDYSRVGLQDFGKKGNYFERQYYRWNKAFKMSIPEGIKEFDDLSKWLGKNLPTDSNRTIVHGDYRLDNLVFHPKTRAVNAVLDWELSTLGDPLSDLGYFLGIMNAPKDFFMSGFGGVDREILGVPSEVELLSLYCDKLELKNIQNWSFYKAFGYFRLSSICAGIQARVQLGNAVDPASKMFASLTAPLAKIGLSQIV